MTQVDPYDPEVERLIRTHGFGRSEAIMAVALERGEIDGDLVEEPSDS